MPSTTTCRSINSRASNWPATCCRMPTIDQTDRHRLQPPAADVARRRCAAKGVPGDLRGRSRAQRLRRLDGGDGGLCPVPRPQVRSLHGEGLLLAGRVLCRRRRRRSISIRRAQRTNFNAADARPPEIEVLTRTRATAARSLARIWHGRDAGDRDAADGTSRKQARKRDRRPEESGRRTTMITVAIEPRTIRDSAARQLARRQRRRSSSRPCRSSWATIDIRRCAGPRGSIWPTG